MIKQRAFYLWKFYRDGFQNMTWGRTLWLIILVKLFFLFCILKLFFFPSSIKGNTDSEKQDFIRNVLIERANKPINNNL